MKCNLHLISCCLATVVKPSHGSFDFGKHSKAKRKLWKPRKKRGCLLSPVWKMDGMLRWKTNCYLYGPNRISAGTEIKNLLLRDHVLQKGEWHLESKRANPWDTTFAHSFKLPLSARQESRKISQPAGRQKAAFILGTNNDAILTTISKDYDRKWLKTPKKVQPDMGTSIPDFAPKYMSNRQFGKDGSIYANSFHQVKRADTSQNSKDRKQYTKDLRTTHFQLGTSHNGYDSETTHRFCAADNAAEVTPAQATNAAQTNQSSSLFRDGDWNETGRPCMTNSVTRHDYHIKPFTAARQNGRQILPRLPKADDVTVVMSLHDVIREAILTKHDTNEASLRRAFAEFDPEKSGYITKEDAKKAIAKYRTAITDAELESLISECNPGQRDNKLDYGAFAIYLAGFSRPAVVEPVPIIHQENYTGTHYMKTCYPNPNTGKPKDNPNHPFYHVSTHFELGDITEDPKSVYHKDFMMGKRDPRSKPLPAEPPMSSQVLPTTQDLPETRSTNMTDYVDPTERDRDIAKIRDREATRNQNRLSKQSVAITCDPRNGDGHRQASVSGADYPYPPKDYPTLSPRHAPQSRYRYLDTDGVLLQPPRGPPRSEIQDQFIPLNDQGSTVAAKQKNTECLERIADNRSSHFALGTDSEPRGSEQHHQFAKKAPFAPSVLAAGKTEVATNTYSHVYPSESADRGHATEDAPQDEAALIQARLHEMNKMRYGIPRDPVNADVERAFLEFDPDLSGKISKENLSAACEKLNVVNLSPEQFDMLYESCSKDKLGFIDYNQFMRYFTSESALVRGTKPSMASVMKSDYCPPEQRSFTSAQQHTIDIARSKPFAVMEPHYFHLANTKDGDKLTTTRHDFSRPDRSPGRHLTNN